MGGRLTATDLLAWSVLNTATENEDAPTVPGPAPHHEPIDPKWIELLLGKPESARMTELDINARLASFDELEMLVESSDNANDLEPLKLWGKLLEIIQSTPEPELRMFSAWVMGTAVQNNEKSQLSVILRLIQFQKNRGISIVLKALQDDLDNSVRLKALYCISAAVRLNKENFDSFQSMNGFDICAALCRDGDEQLMKRTLFFLTALALDTETLGVCEATKEAVRANGFVEMVLNVIPSAEASALEEYLQWLVSMATLDISLIHEYKNGLLQQLSIVSTDGSPEIATLVDSLKALI